MTLRLDLLQKISYYFKKSMTLLEASIKTTLTFLRNIYNFVVSNLVFYLWYPLVAVLGLLRLMATQFLSPFAGSCNLCIELSILTKAAVNLSLILKY